jgi:hypothetical protein
VAHPHRLRHQSLVVTHGHPGSARRVDTRPLAHRVLHHIGDTTYGEHASQVRTGIGPQVMAALATGIMKLAGHHKIAAASRHQGRYPNPATLGLSPA